MAYASWMKALEQEVLALPQQERKRGRVDTTFKVGDQVLLQTKELLDAAEVGKRCSAYDGKAPFRRQPPRVPIRTR